MSELFSDGESLSAESFSILLVDDDPAITRLLANLLATHGYKTRVADSIASARAELERSDCDLIVLDRRLPDGDGLSLARELKKTDGALKRYILMLTSINSDAAKVEGFDGGADDYVTKPFGHEELLARVRAGLRIVDLQKALIAGNRTLELISTTDVLTGVRNRRWFDDELDRAFAHATRYERALSIALIDIDHFKSVNDTWGHIAGDTVLREIAARVSSTLRKSDSIARIGGEEFAILLPETGLFEAFQFGEKIRAIVNSEAVKTDDSEILLSISAGIASYPHSHFARGTQLVSFADKALYRAKNGGRNRVELERRAEPWRPSRRNTSVEFPSAPQQFAG